MSEKIERVIAALSPGWAASRARAKIAYEQHNKALSLVRKYEGASTGRRNDGWVRPGTSANTEIASSAAGLRNGARQLVRDNGHAANALNVLETNVIGTGIRPDFEADSDAALRLIEDLWSEHVERETSGASGGGNFYTRQGLGFRTIVESGSVLLRRRKRPGSWSLPLPYQVQLLEPDYLDTTRDGQYRGNDVVCGKEYNKYGEVVAYHVYLSHPGDSLFGRNYGSTRVRADEIAHAFRADRPGQVHGASWFAPVITTLRDLADTRDAYQLRQKIAACYTAFIMETEPGGGTSHPGQPITDHIEPGRIESLPPGKDVKFAAPPGVDGMSDFDKAQLMTIAVGLGIPYEALTGDLRNVTFLSGRMGWLAFYRNIDSWRAKVVIPQLCEPEMRWFLQAAETSRGLNSSVRVHWISPHRDLLNPADEIKALREEMRLGALSYPDMVKMRGRDPNRVIAAIEQWKKDLDERELYFDWNCEKFSMAGNLNNQNTETTSE